MTQQVFLSDQQIAARYGLKSRETAWLWARKGIFPQPIKLSPGCTRWKLADLEAWEATK
jgi:prophage regulatory protein